MKRFKDKKKNLFKEKQVKKQMKFKKERSNVEKKIKFKQGVEEVK